MNMINKLLLRYSICCLVLASFCSSANAFVECNVTPARYFVSDGFLWVTWNEGGAGVIYQDDQDFKPTLMTVASAVLAKRQLTVRYADGTSCSGVPVPILGVWIWS